MQMLAIDVLKTKSEAREGNKVLFEVVYGKDNTEPRNSIAGVAEAYKTIWNQYPENYGKFDTGPDIEEPDTSTGPEEPVPDTRNFKAIVEHGYRGILGRDADPGGTEAYVNLFKGGASVLMFCKSLMASDEYKSNRAILPHKNLAEDFYRGILGRDADPGGLEHAIEFIQNGRAAEWTAGMLNSKEFKDRFG
jgi:hypothetical protein